jgi:hypothetical protein
MKKFMMTLVALVIGTSAFAGDNLSINLTNVVTKEVKKSEGPAFSAKSFAGAPVLNHNGQVVGFDIAVLVDQYDQNVAVVRPLAEYSVAGVKVRPVAALSVTPHGDKVYAGMGALIPLGKVVDGLDLEVGAVAPGADLANGFKINGKLIPALKAKINFPELFNGAKKVANEGMKKFSPLGGRF